MLKRCDICDKYYCRYNHLLPKGLPEEYYKNPVCNDCILETIIEHGLMYVTKKDKNGFVEISLEKK